MSRTSTSTSSYPRQHDFHEHDVRTPSPEHEGGTHREGRVATTIERQTARLPSDAYLWAAFASMGGSLMLQMLNRKEDALFVGQWAPAFLCLGLYNKLVKLHGHDYAH